MSAPAPNHRAGSNLLLDGLAAVLLGVFVLMLFLGYLNMPPGVPYSDLAAIPLVGSLAMLGWANLLADRHAMSPG